MIQKNPPPKLFAMDIRLDSSDETDKEKSHGSLSPAVLQIQVYIDYEVMAKMSKQADEAKAASTVVVTSQSFLTAMASWMQLSQHVRSKNDGRFLYLVYALLVSDSFYVMAVMNARIRCNIFLHFYIPLPLHLN